jgi:hypothetical protein
MSVNSVRFSVQQLCQNGNGVRRIRAFVLVGHLCSDERARIPVEGYMCNDLCWLIRKGVSVMYLKAVTNREGATITVLSGTRVSVSTSLGQCYQHWISFAGIFISQIST